MARRVAETFSSTDPITRTTRNNAMLAIRGLSSTAPSVYNQPAYYVYNLQEGGFVVVAGDDIARPILAYSTVGKIESEQISECERDWLDYYGRIIYDISQRNLAPSSKTAEEWSRLSNGRMPERGTDVVLQTAAWNQLEPYNRFCPTIGGYRAVTGCTNTACAIIMKYYEHPQSGTGIVGGYTYWRNDVWYKMDSYALGHTYDWEQMPDNYIWGEYTDYQAEQVAHLMKDLGYGNKTSYGNAIDDDGSTASLQNAVSSLLSHYDYDRSLVEYQHEFVSEDKWRSIIRDEIDQKRPILICGYPAPGGGLGHSFVICGYSGDYYCFNMGWGWGSSTFALISPIDGYENELIQYYQNQMIYVHIMPNQGGQPPQLEDVYIKGLGISSWAYQTEGYFCFGSSPSFYPSPINALGGEFECVFALLDAKSNIKEILSVEVGRITSNSSSGKYQICRVPSNYSQDDCIALCIRRPGEKEWRVADHAPDGVRPMKYNGNIADAISIIAYVQNGNRVIRIYTPNSIAVEMKRDDGLLDGTKYAYQIIENDGTFSYFHDTNSCVYLEGAFQIGNGKPGVWNVRFLDSEKEYTIKMVL